MHSECEQIGMLLNKMYVLMDKVFSREDKYYSRLNRHTEGYYVVYDEFLLNQKKLQRTISDASSAVSDLEITLRSLKQEKTRMETIRNRRRQYDLDRQTKALERDSALFSR